MSICPLPNSEKSTVSVATKLENGSEISASGRTPDNLQLRLSGTDLFVKGQALSQEPITTFGISQKPQKSSTAWATNGPFSLRNNSSFGWEILDANGITVAWTTSPVLAHVICSALNEKV